MSAAQGPAGGDPVAEQVGESVGEGAVAAVGLLGVQGADRDHGAAGPDELAQHAYPVGVQDRCPGDDDEIVGRRPDHQAALADLGVGQQRGVPGQGALVQQVEVDLGAFQGVGRLAERCVHVLLPVGAGPLLGGPLRLHQRGTGGRGAAAGLHDPADPLGERPHGPPPGGARAEGRREVHPALVGPQGVQHGQVDAAGGLRADGGMHEPGGDLPAHVAEHLQQGPFAAHLVGHGDRVARDHGGLTGHVLGGDDVAAGHLGPLVDLVQVAGGGDALGGGGLVVERVGDQGDAALLVPLGLLAERGGEAVGDGLPEVAAGDAAKAAEVVEGGGVGEAGGDTDGAQGAVEGR
ncbi:hypothetical protein [Streptomyces violaceorubidus]|uniref:Uncharacterized protein n=1 Tax=Streptomyces violaceorubidus TaxID=284042 RepID=A0ABV1T045_9ACTN